MPKDHDVFELNSLATTEQSFEDRLSKPSILASHIGGKLARELKAADINSLQAVIY